MRRRPWVLVVLLFFVVTVMGFYTGWRVTRANEKLRALLITKIEPFVAQGSGIESLEINLSSVRLHGVRLIPKNRTFSLEIESIEIGYRFLNVLRYGFSPSRIAHEVMLIHPVFILHERKTQVTGSGDSNWESFQELLSEFTAVRSFTVLDAEVVIADSLNQIVLGHDLDGWLQTTPLDSAILRLSGRFLESKDKNLQLNAILNLRLIRPEYISWSIEPSKPPESIPVLIPDFIQVQGGTLLGEGTYIYGESLHGSIEIRDGAFRFINHPFLFENVRALGQLQGDSLAFTGSVGSFNGSELHFSGKLSQWLNPRLDVQVHCSAFRIKPFFDTLITGSKVAVEGIGQFDLRAVGALNNPYVSGRISAEEFTLSYLKMYAVSSEVILRDSLLVMETEGRFEDGLNLNLSNTIDLSKPQFPAQIQMRLDGDMLPLMPDPVQTFLSHFGGKLESRLSGPLSGLTGQMGGVLYAESKTGQVMRFEPNLTYGQKRLDIDIRSNGSFSAIGYLDRFLASGQTWKFNVFGAESFIESIFGESVFRWIEGQNVYSELDGNSRGWRCSTRSVRQQSDSLAWQWQLETQKLDRKVMIQLTGALYADSSKTIPFKGSALWDKQSCTIQKFSCADFLAVKADIPFMASDPFRLEIEFRDMALNRLYPLFPALTNYQGQIKGSVRMEGTRLSPETRINLSFYNGQLHEEKGFEGGVSGFWEKDTLRSFGCHFNRQNQRVLEGQVRTLENDSLNGHFQGKNLDLARLTEAFTGRSHWGGQCDFKLRISGQGIRPILSGVLNVSQGRVQRFGYDSLEVHFSDTLSSGWGIQGSVLNFTRGRIDRSDGAGLKFEGKLPLSSSEDMDLSVRARGNIVRTLSDFVDFIKKGNGQGEAYFRLGGRPESPFLGSASLSVTDGSVSLADIVSEINGINLSAQMDQDSRFFIISNLSGKIHNRGFRFWNENSRQDLPVLAMENLGVHFGHLYLETDKRGIQIHVPGLMEKGDEGMVAFTGLTENRPFLIAGGETGPAFQGTLNLNNLRLTYPFHSIGSGDAANVVTDFLKRVSWNIRVQPMSDVHYVRSIESPFGNVYADLQLKKDYGRLNIHGIIDEESLQVWGSLESTEGNIEILDLYFRPERITFDYPRGAGYPIVSGRAYTTVIDSTGIPSTVWLTLTTTDHATGLEKQGGSWKNILFRFGTDNPNLARTEADLLAAMGYSLSQIRERAYDALGSQVENLVFRPIFRPLEREMRRYLGLDVVRFSSKFSSNLMQRQTEDQPAFDPKFLFRSSRVTLGKYLTPGLFVTYSGQVQTAWKYQYHDEGLGFRHALSLEYTFRPDLFLEMEYTYDTKLLYDRREDKRIWLRHVFPF